MCGLVAAIDDVFSSTTAASPPADVPILSDISALTAASSVLRHRGPDGMRVSTGKVGRRSGGGGGGVVEARWSMGHTRLAIVDPSNRNADMPFDLRFDGAGKTIHLAANGEIYNHDALYRDMAAGNDGSEWGGPWTHGRISGSDCEVIAHAYARYGGPRAASVLDGMFAFVIFEEDTASGEVRAFAARDPVGIKPLYYGRTRRTDSDGGGDDGGAAAYVFASELKALVGRVDPSTAVALPPGHYWTPEGGPVRYYGPDWLMKDDYAPWDDDDDHNVTDDEIRFAFTDAVKKRMMSDVEYGLFLSGGVDSCVVAHDLLPLYRADTGDDRPIPTYTVGMENSPDVMAARAMVDSLGGDRYVDHRVRSFTPEEVFDLIPRIVYHMETYEAELIRSAIPNWLLAERAAADVKMVLTGEGADELFAGYLYFKDAETPRQLQDELRRIYGMLGNVNLHRTDRMTMAHGLEARVPFLDTDFTRLVMSVDPARKMVNGDAVTANARGREKTLLRELFEGPNTNGDSIPRPVLWRAKAMQCEGVGEDWVSILQRRISALVSDAEMDDAGVDYPVNTPHTKEELYYRRIYDDHFRGMEHVVKLWEGGGRAMGAEWKSDMYTREGLRDVNLLSHSLQQSRAYSTSHPPSASALGSTELRQPPPRRSLPPPPRRYRSALAAPAAPSSSSPAVRAAEEARSRALSWGYTDLEAWLTSGGDDRSIIDAETGTNKYHISPRPVDPHRVFRGSCTGNPPTERGYRAAGDLYENVLSGLGGIDLDSALRDAFEDQRSRISSLLDLPDGAEVVLCPSGSDAEYVPLAVARALRPESKIVSGVSQLHEIGAGSAPAALGRYFSSRAPLLGAVSDEMEYLSGFEGIDGITVTARDRDGSAVDSTEEMAEFASRSIARGSYPVVRGVFGGKTGLRDGEMPPSPDGGATSLGVVDACQGRFSKYELRGWLDRDSLVLFTASKFYQAPPFCGAVVVPPAIAERLRRCPPPCPPGMLGPDGLGGFVTDKEVPPCMGGWKALLRGEGGANNVGLALRWEAGLAGMESLSSVSDGEREDAVRRWADAVSGMVRGRGPLLDPWCAERSVVSVRVAKRGGGGGWLGMGELRDLYRWMSLDVSGEVPDAAGTEREALSRPAHIGQPVDVSDAHAVVRIALGAESLLSYIRDEEGTLEEDRVTVRKLAAIAGHFDTLKKSGR